MLERGVTTKPPHLSNNSPCEYCGGNHPSFWCCKRHYDHECTQAYAAPQQNAHTHQEANHICSDVSPKRILHVLQQAKFIQDAVQKFGLTNAHFATTPCLVSSVKNTRLTHDVEASHQPYANLVGCLQFGGLNTRLDILCTANFLGQYLAAPSMQHLSTAKRVLKYLKGTFDLGLVYQCHIESSSVMSLDLSGYTDADWASSHFSMQSTRARELF